MTPSRDRLLLAATCAMLALTSVHAQRLTPEQLRQAGFHLPSYMPTIRDFWEYSARALTTHQELTVEWDSLPGRSEYVRYEDVKDIPVFGNFVITARRRRVKGAPAMGDWTLGMHGLVVVGITTKYEVRYVLSRRDPRVIQGEDLTAGHERSDFLVTPKVTLKLNLPDDPQIQTLVFLQPKPTNGTLILERIGTLSLSDNQ